MDSLNKLVYKAAIAQDKTQKTSQQNSQYLKNKTLNESQEQSFNRNQTLPTSPVKQNSLTQQTLQQSQNEKQKLLTEIEELKGYNQHLQQQLSLKTDVLEQSLIAQYKTAIDYLNDQLLTMKEQAKNYDENFEKYQKIEEEYEIMSIQLAKAKQALIEQFDSYDEKINTQEDKILKLTVELNEAKKFIEENQLDQLREAIKYQQEDAQKIQQDYKTQIQFHQQKITNLEDGIKQTIEENDKFKVHNQELAKELNKMLSELNKFQSKGLPEKNVQINSLNELKLNYILQIFQSLIASVNKEVFDLKKQIENLTQSLNQTTKELNEVKSQYETQKNELVKANELLQKFHGEVTFLNSKTSKLGQSLKETSKKAETLKENERIHQQNFDSKSKEIERLKAQLSQQEAQNKAILQQLNDKHSIEIKKYSYQQEKLNNEKQLLTQEMNQMKQYYQALKKKIADEETNNLKKNSLVQQLKNQVYKLQNDNEILTQENKVWKYKSMKSFQDIGPTQKLPTTQSIVNNLKN